MSGETVTRQIGGMTVVLRHCGADNEGMLATVDVLARGVPLLGSFERELRSSDGRFKVRLAATTRRQINAFMDEYGL